MFPHFTPQPFLVFCIRSRNILYTYESKTHLPVHCQYPGFLTHMGFLQKLTLVLLQHTGKVFHTYILSHLQWKFSVKNQMTRKNNWRHLREHQLFSSLMSQYFVDTKSCNWLLKEQAFIPSLIVCNLFASHSPQTYKPKYMTLYDR